MFGTAFIVSFLVLGFISIATVSIYTAITYNKLVRLTKNVDEAWGNVTVALAKRHAVLPTVVTAVKQGGAAHEAAVHHAVAALRNGDIYEVSIAEQNLQVGMLAEAYPRLKVDAQFNHLFNTLVELENTIQGERLIFNRAVAHYRRTIQEVPSHFVAKAFGFIPVEFFEVETVPVHVAFDTTDKPQVSGL